MPRHAARLALLCLAAAASAAEPPTMPMPIPHPHAARTRWQAKTVHASRVVADMESLDRWKLSTWAQGKGDIALTGERSRDGSHSLRFRSRTVGEKPSPGGGVFGSTAAVRAFDGEDWSDYNRLAFWVRPDLPGHHAISLMVRLTNRRRGPARVTHHVLLEDRRWNRVVWEIPDIARDEVTAVAFTYVMNGREAGAAETATFDIDRLELQRVDADPYEGWGVWPGRIALCHTGYRPGAPKVALVGGPPAGTFAVENAAGKAVLTGEVRRRPVPAGQGELGVMDFSELAEPGTYRLGVGGLRSRPFRVAEDIWERTIWKAVNFFYVERCGAAVPGVHDVCHADFRCEHGGRTIVINGGWHDAGDLSQGLINTSEATYAMFELAAGLAARSGDAALVDRLIEEACWGLQWVLKTSFRDGWRVEWGTHRFWTNNRIGDVDDVMAKPRRSPPASFYAAAAEARAYRTLKARRSRLAARALEMAREDWAFGREGFDAGKPEDLVVEHVGLAVLASLELYHATGEAAYGDTARKWAELLLASQQRQVDPALDRPITGWFHRTTRRRRAMQYAHRGHEQAPVVALAGLCEAFPDDAKWIDWYAAVALHSTFYQQEMAKLTAPWSLLPNSLHRHRPRPDADRREADRQEQIANGFDVGGRWRVRVFAVHPRRSFRGNYGTVLSQAKAVAAAGRLRRRADLLDLARRQLQWVVGLNPFCQSTMVGEGYDFAPQYTARSGEIVGSLPVGMKSFGNRDLPYWPVTNVWNYKEVWVHPVSRWLWLMCDLHAAPAAGGVAVEAGREGDTVTVTARPPAGTKALELRAFNLKVPPARRVAGPAGGKGSVVWRCEVAEPGTPWVAVVVPDGQVARRGEAVGP